MTLPRGIQLVRSIPEQLRFTFERRIAREVPVNVRLSAPHEGYAVVSVKVTPRAAHHCQVRRRASNKCSSVTTDLLDISGVISQRDNTA